MKAFKLQTGGYSVGTTIDNAVYNAMQDAASQYGGLLDQGGSSGVEVGNIAHELMRLEQF